MAPVSKSLEGSAAQRPSRSIVAERISSAIDKRASELREINKKIHENPELGYEEYHAHDNIVALLGELNFHVTPHAYGLATSFEAEFGGGGRVVVFNAEYDALPDIGHACGHNLIATASISAFLGLVAALKATNAPGRVRLLGTPAEEGGGGKVKLLNAGAYKDVDACLMVHPVPMSLADEAVPPACENCGCSAVPGKATGVAYMRTLANKKFNARFTGKPAHAALAPYQGLNSLDAVVLGYNGVSMLRQQMKTTDRIHSIILEGGTRPNIITASATTQYYVRSTSLEDTAALKRRVTNCLDGAALATATTLHYEVINEYADMRPNLTICDLYTQAMADLGSYVVNDSTNDDARLGSTDQGNVSYCVPSFHGVYGIPCPPESLNHTPGFTACAATDEAHRLTILTGKGMAMAAWQILTDDATSERMKSQFEEDRNRLDLSAREGW